MGIDPIDIWTLEVMIAGVVATAFLGVATLIVGGIAAYIAWRAAQDSKAATEREQTRIELAERQVFADKVRSYLVHLSRNWDAVAAGHKSEATELIHEYTDLFEFGMAMATANSAGLMLVYDVQQYEAYMSGLTNAERASPDAGVRYVKLRNSVTLWVSSPSKWFEGWIAESRAKAQAGDQ